MRVGYGSPISREFLSDEQKTDSARRIQALAVAVGAPPEIIDRTTTLLTTATDREVMLNGALDLNHQLSRWFDRQQGPGTPRARQEQLKLWQFCGYAARAAIALSHGASADIVDSYVRRARRGGDGLSPPPLWEPFVTAIQIHADYDTVRDLASDLDRTITEYLSSPRSRN